MCDFTILRCGVIAKPESGSTNTYKCKRMEGRYINIVIPGKRTFLTICEVKVIGQPSKNPTPNGELNINNNQNCGSSSSNSGGGGGGSGAFLNTFGSIYHQ